MFPHVVTQIDPYNKNPVEHSIQEVEFEQVLHPVIQDEQINVPEVSLLLKNWSGQGLKQPPALE